MTEEAVPAGGALPVDGTDVLAVLVTRPDQANPALPTTDGLAALQSILLQQPPPGIAVVAHVGDTPPEPLELDATETLVVQVHVPDATNFGQAVEQALESLAVQQIPGAARASWLWLVHDDMVMMPGALATMLILGRTSGSIAAIGPKQVSYQRPDRLLELGIKATGSARRVEDIEIDEIDQGQYDSRSDVLAVGTAGMLTRKSAWERVGGLDPALGPFGDGLEYGQRLRRAGNRVVVAPQAKALHRQASHNIGADASNSFEDRRAAQLYNWVVSESVWLLPLLLLWLPILTLGRVLGRLVTKEPRLALAEAGAYFKLVGKSGAILRARKRLASVSTVPRSTLRQMHAGPGDIMRARRMRRKVATQKKLGGPVLDAQALAARRTYRIRSAAALVTVLVGSGLLAAFTWRAFTGGPVGALWGDLPTRWGSLASQALSGWQVTGDGAAGPASSKLLPLTLLSAPFALLGISPGAVGQWVMYLALPLAAASGWALAATFTRSIPLRVALSLAWLGGLPLLTVLIRGDLAQTLAYVALPWVLIGIWRGRGRVRALRLRSVSDVIAWPRPDYLSWFALAGIALLFVAPAAPVLLGVALLFAIVVVLRARKEPLDKSAPQTSSARWGPKVGLAVAFLPALVWVLPELVARVSWSSPAQFWVWLAGGMQVGTDLPAWWAFLAGSPVDPTAFVADAKPTWLAVISLAAGGTVLVLTVARFLFLLFRGRDADRARLTWAGALLFVALLALAGATSVTLLSSGTQVSPLLMGVALLLFLVVLPSLSGQPEIASKAAELRHKTGAVATYRAAVGTAISLASLVTMGVVLGLGPLQANSTGEPSSFALAPVGDQGFPLIAAEAQESPRQARVLSLSKSSGTLNASLLRGSGVQLADLLMQEPLLDGQNTEALLDADSELALAATVLASGIRSDGAELVAQHAVDIVLLASGSEDQGKIANVLDASEGLERIGSIESGSMWRVRPDGARPSRVTVTSGEAISEVDSEVVQVDTDIAVKEQGTLRLAETKDAAWTAWFNGEKLTQVGGEDWATEFAIPAGEGRLQVRYQEAYVSWWVGASAALLVILGVSAIPWRSRPARLRVADPEGEEPVLANSESVGEQEALEPDLPSVSGGDA